MILDSPETRPTTQCAGCRRDGELRFVIRENFGLERGFKLEPVVLCEACALMRDDIL